MEIITIQQLVEQAVETYRQNGYSESSVQRVNQTFLRIIDLHQKSNFDHFAPDVLSEFVEKCESRYLSGKIKRRQYRDVTNAAKFLVELHDTKAISFARRRISPNLSDYFENLLDKIKADSPNRKSRYIVWEYAKPYFAWLQSEGHSDLSKVDENVIRQYLVNCSSRVSSGSLETTRNVLKRLYDYLFKTGLSECSFGNTLSFSIPVESKIKPAIPNEEVAAALSAIDRNTVMGKRDYAMILLGIVTGLRSVDIVNLKREDIDWRNGEIRINQSKTGKALSLPLTTDVGQAVEDYLLNGRPSSSISNIFLRLDVPLKKLGRKIPYDQHNSYRRKAGLPIFSFHGLRRALGRNMVMSGVSLTTVAQSLGQTGLSATKQYVPFDSENLKECALGFVGIETSAENLCPDNSGNLKGGDAL